MTSLASLRRKMLWQLRVRSFFKRPTKILIKEVKKEGQMQLKMKDKLSPRCKSKQVAARRLDGSRVHWEQEFPWLKREDEKVFRNT